MIRRIQEPCGRPCSIPRCTTSTKIPSSCNCRVCEAKVSITSSRSRAATARRLVSRPSHEHRREKDWRGSDSKRTDQAEHRARRLRVLRRDGNRCQIRWETCTVAATVLDHIIALGLGGADVDANCQAACDNCSTAKANIEAHISAGHRVQMPPMRRDGVMAAAVPAAQPRRVGIPRCILPGGGSGPEGDDPDQGRVEGAP